MYMLVYLEAEEVSALQLVADVFSWEFVPNGNAWCAEQFNRILTLCAGLPIQSLADLEEAHTAVTQLRIVARQASPDRYQLARCDRAVVERAIARAEAILNNALHAIGSGGEVIHHRVAAEAMKGVQL